MRQDYKEVPLFPIRCWSFNAPDDLTRNTAFDLKELEYRNYNLRFTSNVDDIPPHAPTPHWARLGGTPLNSAIVITAEVVKRFQSNYNIQKMNTHSFYEKCPFYVHTSI